MSKHALLSSHFHSIALLKYNAINISKIARKRKQKATILTSINQSNHSFIILTILARWLMACYNHLPWCIQSEQAGSQKHSVFWKCSYPSRRNSSCQNFLRNTFYEGHSTRFGPVPAHIQSSALDEKTQKISDNKSSVKAMLLVKSVIFSFLNVSLQLHLENLGLLEAPHFCRIEFNANEQKRFFFFFFKWEWELIYIAQIPCHMSKCALQLACIRSNWKIVTGCRYTVHVWSLIGVYGIYGRGQITAPGEIPLLFSRSVWVL